jgi:hypothetical protein
MWRKIKKYLKRYWLVLGLVMTLIAAFLIQSWLLNIDHNYSRTSRNITLITERIKAYHIRNNRLPQSLDELGLHEKFLRSPWDNKRISYSVEGDTVLLKYSDGSEQVIRVGKEQYLDEKK